MKVFNKTIFAAFCLALLGSRASAEDIDIYAAQTGLESNPNVVIVVDNSANWNSNAQHWPGGIKQGQAELNAIRTVISELGSDVNIGLMLFTAGTSANNPDGPGGYVRFHLRPMDLENKTSFADLLGHPDGCTEGLNENGTPNCIYQNFSQREQVGTAKTDYSAMLFEVFKYFGGHTRPGDTEAGAPVSRTQFGPLRYAGDPSDNKMDLSAYTSAAKSEYTQVITEEENCAQNYVIFIGNGFPNTDSPCSLLEGVGGSCNPQLEMPELMEANTVTESLIETTTCGTYDSIAQCEADAQARFGDAYDSYTCQEYSQCSAGSTVTETAILRASECDEFADIATCEASLPANTPTETYSCQELNPSCVTLVDLNPRKTFGPTDCIDAKKEENCIAWAKGQWPEYDLFSCSDGSKSSCSGGLTKWSLVQASKREVPGKTFSLVKTTTSTTTAVTKSHRIYGTRTLSGVTPTGERKPPDSPNNADEWAKFLNRTDVSPAKGLQNVTVYTIDVFKDKQEAAETALLYSMADAGGGKYFQATNEQAIKDALRKILVEIQSVNSVFASSSLPVSVNTQGTYLNQVFIGMFRPNSGAGPRWAGNLKQFQFKFFLDELKLADKNGDEAISATTGFITPCADSIWTTDSGSYWDYSGSEAAGSCTAQSSQYASSSFYSDAPDGDVVEKGGAAQRLRGVSGTTQLSTNYVTRNLLTCAAPGCDNVVDFNTSNVSAAALGVSTTTERDSLIDWIRGKDVDDENSNGEYDEVRPSVHGGVIHAQPAVVDYGADGVVAYYGADDGVLHAIAGGIEDSEGHELWGFIAPETFDRFKRLRTNDPLIAFPELNDVTALPKDYYFDGPIGVYQRNGTTWIFPSMRRGGRAIYAFDVSDPDAEPVIKWRKGCFTNATSDDSACSTDDTYDWSDIGQTWSKPQLAYIQGYVDGAGTAKPVLVFGGGYDTCEDTASKTPPCTAPKGANIWFVDALTGDVLHRYDTLRSVPGDVALLFEGRYLQYVYATDTGGNIYRVNVGSYDTDAATDAERFVNWSSGGIQIAALGGDGRKFLFGPDVVQYGTYNAVLAGTGDRERPLWSDYPCNSGASGGVTNRFYMVKDIVTAGVYPETPYEPDDLLDVTNIANSTTEALAAKQGWLFNLGICEQVVNKPLTFAGDVHFGTNQPAAVGTACGRNLGTARGYAVNFRTGKRTFTVFEGGGLPPSPVAGVVDVDGVKVPFIIGGGGDSDDEEEGTSGSPLQGKKVDVSPPSVRRKLYWHKEND